MNILVLGGDKRAVFTAQRLSKYHSVAVYGTGGYNLPPQQKCDCAVLGLPCTKDGITLHAPMLADALPLDTAAEYVLDGGIVIGGMITPALRSICRARKIFCEDYYDDESVILKNAVLTAEGAIAHAISNTESGIFGMNILITGYGRIASLLARYLTAMGGRVTVAARNKACRTKAELIGCEAVDFDGLSDVCEKCSLIFNTVPAAVFHTEEILVIPDNAVYIELASHSGIAEIPLSDCKFRIINAQGLPSKTAPCSAGFIIADAVCDILNRYKSMKER